MTLHIEAHLPKSHISFSTNDKKILITFENFESLYNLTLPLITTHSACGGHSVFHMKNNDQEEGQSTNVNYSDTKRMEM